MSTRPPRIVARVTCLAALLVFLGLGWAVKPYVEELRDLARLDSTDANEAQAAARRLAKAGSRRATERLVKLLGRASKEQTWVSEALRERLPGALPILAAELENEWEAGDLEVVRFLEELEEDARPVAPSFVKALERLDKEDSALSVSFALLEIDPNAHELVRPLLRSPVRAARLNALGIFQMADTVPASRVPDVAALLEDEDATVRSDAAWTLSRLRPEAVTARAALVPRRSRRCALEADPALDQDVQHAAAYALSSILGTEEQSKLLPGEAERLALDLESSDLEQRELALGISRIPAKVDTHSEVKPDGDSGGSGTAVSEEAEQRQRDADGVKEQQDPPG